MSNSVARLGVAGHAGIGHTHCPGDLIQDDTVGFAVAAAILRDALQVDTRVASVEVSPDRNTIEVTTVDGGVGEASPRRGITPAEARLIAGITGRDALLCQAVAVDALGRMYGQGVLETPVALAAALANSVVDTFHRKAPDGFQLARESVSSNFGLIGGMALERSGVHVSVMATVNASSGGIGPNEDLEGNLALGSKRGLMERLGLLRCPTIVLEGKAYSPAFSGDLQKTTFLVRCQRDLDNIVVAEALRDSAQELGYPVIFRDDAFPPARGTLRRKTVDLADSIIRSAGELKQAELGSDKVRIVAELARLVSQECGGVSFMTDALHDAVRQVGLMQGTAAVLSMLVTRDHLAHWKIPVLEPEDVDMMKHVVYGAVPRIASRMDEAMTILERLYVDTAMLELLIEQT